MTNASIKHSSVVFFVALACVASMVSFASIAKADDLGYLDTYGSNLGYGDTYGSNLGYGDTYGDNLGYGDTYGNNLGYGDTYGSNLGYGDTYGDNLGYADTYGSPSDNSYAPYSSSPTYSPSTPYYNPSTASYSSAPMYSSAPSFSSASPFAPAPFVSAPSSAPSITSQHQTQSQSSYNSNPNTNTNYTPSISSASATNANTNTFNPTNTNTNTNNPTAVATNGPITNTNNASTGPINIQNTVNVVPAPAGHNIQYTLPTPSCTIYAGSGPSYSTGYGYNYNNSYNYNNQPVTLSWSSQNATSAYITPNVGTVAPSGSTTVYPYGYTTYTMTISGPGGTATCQTSANYAPVAVPSYIAPPVYTQPAAPVVSLTQIPYTGFDYGPVGNAIYWMSMFAFAAAAGYLLVYFRGGAMNFASSLVGSRSSGSEMQNSFETEEMDETPVSISQTEETAAPVYAFELPSIERSRITTDSMIIDQSEGAPRIVIART